MMQRCHYCIRSTTVVVVPPPRCCSLVGSQLFIFKCSSDPPMTTPSSLNSTH